MNEAKNAADVERIMAELADDYAVRSVAYVLHWKCKDRVSRLEERVRKLQLEIERLELINNVCDQLSSRVGRDFERDDGSIIVNLLNRQSAQ